MLKKCIFFIIGIILTVNNGFALNVSTSGNKSAECSVCHISWMRDFKDTKKTPLVPEDAFVKVKTGRQRISSIPRMCYSCHDGYVNDSRIQFRKGAHEHSVGIKPSKKIQRPKLKGEDRYPLNQDGKVYCGTCHSPHVNPWKKGQGLFMRSRNKNSSMCTDCHKQQISKPHNNHPMTELKSDLPKKLKRSGSLIGERKQIICQTCHKTHAATSSTLLVGNDHQARLCLGCHDKKKDIVGSKHDLAFENKGRKNSKGLNIHEHGTCSACHANHGSAIAPLLMTSKKKATNNAWYQCVVCHNEDGVAKKSGIGQHSHPVDVSITKVGIQVKNKKWQKGGRPLHYLPLYDKKGNPSKNNGDLQCGTCHDPHLNSKEDNAFLRLTKTNYSRLCANCHLEQIKVANSKHSILLYDNAQLKKVSSKIKVARGSCYGCHRTHNAKANPILSILNNGEMKDTAIKTLCTHCHKKSGVASRSKINHHDHPNRLLKKSANVRLDPEKTGLPLFLANGRRTKNEKAFVDCSTCHDAHTWDSTKPNSKEGRNMRAVAHGGNSFLRFTSDGNSKLCRVCHIKESQVVKTDHDFRMTAKRMKNHKGLQVADSGVCGQCHSAHNNVNSFALWSRKPGKADDRRSAMCRSCHFKGSRVTNKTVPYGNHPAEVVLWSTPRRFVPGISKIDPLPLFTTQGRRTEYGIMACTSCHDPHQWRGNKIAYGPGVPTEGSSVNSFLKKHSVDNTVCADCHGLDALYRFQYYHSKSNTQRHTLYLEAPQQKANR